MDDSNDSYLAYLDAVADLMMRPCEFCAATVEVAAMRGELPRALGIDHQPDCPMYAE